MVVEEARERKEGGGEVGVCRGDSWSSVSRALTCGVVSIVVGMPGQPCLLVWSNGSGGLLTLSYRPDMVPVD